MTVQETIQWLKETRIKKEFSQGDMDSMIGAEAKSVSRWESGDAVPSVTDFISWCSVFGAEVSINIKSQIK